jgi:dihydrofolate reductase
MRRVILQEFTSIDGFAAGPNGELDFISNSTEIDSVQSEAARDQLTFIETIDTILLGAVTYRMFVDYWPEQTTDTEAVADALNETPKVVFSQTLERAPWGRWDDARIVAGNATDEIRKLKQDAGKDMVIWGSLSLARSLMKERGLIDEYQILVCPVVLGNGQPLFAGAGAGLKMKLLEEKAYPEGVIRLRYQPAGE